MSWTEMRRTCYGFALAVHLVAVTSGDAGGEYENVAFDKPTYQSSIRRSYLASYAVDGVRNTDFSTNPCTHTKRENKPWWSVDLMNTYTIGYIRITNRSGWCEKTPTLSCNERLARFQVHVSSSVGDVTDRNLCYTSNDTSPPLAINVTCESTLSGRHVIISLTREDILSLCEVEVYVELLKETSNEISSTLGNTNQLHTTHQHQVSTDSSTFWWEITPTLGITRDQSTEWSSDIRVSKSLGSFSASTVFEMSLGSSVRVTRTVHTADASPETTAILPVQSSLYTRLDFSEAPSTPIPTSHITPSFSNSTVAVVSTVEQTQCHCPQNACRRKYTKGLNRDESARFMSSVLQFLDLNLTEVTNQRMRYVCLADDRKSVTSMGAFAMVLIATVFSSLVLSDITKIISEMRSPNI